MLTEAPLSELEVLEWLGQIAQAGNITLTPDQEMPVSWAELVSHLVSLQRQGLIECKIDPGPTCAIKILTSGNRADASRLDNCTPTSFEPSRQTLNRLKQYGFGTGKIADLLNSYRTLYTECTDESFAGFCLRADKTVIESLTTLQSHWIPSGDTLQALSQLGIPQTIQSEYLDSYREEFGNQRVYVSDWNEHFLVRARHKWAADNRNDRASQGTFMSASWTPSDETVAQLVSEGMNEGWLETLALEFRLYWREVGTRRVSWNNQFRWWARRQWPKQHRVERLQHSDGERFLERHFNGKWREGL